MRNITTHIVEGDSVNHQLEISVMDEPGHGGACHDYVIKHGTESALCRVQFQNGPIKEAGVNGLTHEALLAILIDRLEGFQDGPYRSDENAQALANLHSALYQLHARTTARLERGVEGTHTV